MKNSKSGCLGLFVIFIIICGIIGSFQSCFGDEVKLEWQNDNITIADTQTIKLDVKGKYSADELDESDIKIDLSNNAICDVVYDYANYSYIEFKVTPLRYGKTDIIVKYKDFKSDKATLTIDLNEKSDSTSESKLTTNTTTNRTTVTTITTTQPTTTTRVITTTPTPTTTQITTEYVPVQVIGYLLNYKSMIVHRETCHTIKHRENFEYTTDLQAAYNNGFRACKVCKP